MTLIPHAVVMGHVKSMVLAHALLDSTEIPAQVNSVISGIPIHNAKNLYLLTLKSLIQEQTGMSKQAGSFSEIYKQTGWNKQAGENFF